MPRINNQKIKNLIESGSDVAGSGSGAAIGFIIGGPVGAAGGAIIGTGMKVIATEITERFLSKKESNRIGAAFILAVKKIQENQNEGRIIRTDFAGSENVRKKFEELLEGVMLKARDSYEEKKLSFLPTYMQILFIRILALRILIKLFILQKD
jgi:hypothetical protein